jgi:DNA-binding transcriptional regulator/RsmH inhibitor MraZ
MMEGLNQKDFKPSPPMGWWASGTVAKIITVQLDEKGRVRLPAELRRELKSTRFTIRVQNDRILMDPVKTPAEVKGKYKGLIKIGMEELEEAQERLVTSDRR